MLQASNEETYDLVREGVVIFTGALAKHLSKVKYYEIVWFVCLIQKKSIYGTNIDLPTG